MKKVLSVLLICLIIFILAGSFYAKNVHQIVGLYGNTYHAEGTEMGDVTITFGDESADLLYENIDGPDSSMFIQYDYSYESRPKFLFDTYFYGHSILTMRKAQHEGTPIQMDLKYMDGDIYTKGERIPLTTKDVPEIQYVMIYYSSDGIWLDNVWMDQVN